MGSNLFMSFFLHDFDLCHHHNNTIVFVLVDSLVVYIYIYKPELYLIINLKLQGAMVTKIKTITKKKIK